jgi:ribokinase
MKTLVFGSLNIDLIFSVDHIVIPGETISSSGLIKSAGGKGANQAAALAKAGMNVFMAGKIGQDGEFLLKLLGSYGVNTKHTARYEGATGQALIQVDKNGQNSIVLYSGGNGLITKNEIDAALSRFGSDDVAVLQNEIANTGYIIEEAKKRGLRVCLNPSPYDGKIEKLPLDLVDIFFVNEIEAAALANHRDPAAGDKSSLPEILDQLTVRFPKSEIILTAGKDGAYYGAGSVRAKGEILDLPVADTTGAGDTFTGYFLAARQRGMNIEEALNLACKAASIAVSRMGAMEAIPLGGEVF